MTVQEKITQTKEKIATMKNIEKLEKEVAKLKKSIDTKTAKIAELAEQL